MEHIRQAVERAKEHPSQPSIAVSEPQRARTSQSFAGNRHRWEPTREVELDPAHLRSERIFAFDGQDLRSRSFDLLRTEVLRSMDLEGWRTLAVTSPTPNCGKTLTAVNLALSMARQPERQVFLADLDLRKPRVAASLDLECKEGALGVLEGRVPMSGATIRVHAEASNLEILPTSPTTNSSDLVSSKEMKRLLQEIAGDGSRIAILDLPPLLTGHDAVSILPEVDCVLLVAAVGTSKVSEIEECKKYLQGMSLVRFVLNKAPVSSTAYLAYY